jgi:hypothetical protein
MKHRLAVWLLLAGGATVFGGSDDSRAKLLGSWRLQDASGHDSDTVWVLEDKGAALHIIHSEGTHKLADFECTPTGQDCKIKEAGKSANVSLWYNGPLLVELETRGSEIVKRRFGLTADGQGLELETIPVVPSGTPQKSLFKRVATETNAK